MWTPIFQDSSGCQPGLHIALLDPGSLLTRMMSCKVSRGRTNAMTKCPTAAWCSMLDVSELHADSSFEIVIGAKQLTGQFVENVGVRQSTIGAEFQSHQGPDQLERSRTGLAVLNPFADAAKRIARLRQSPTSSSQHGVGLTFRQAPRGQCPP